MWKWLSLTVGGVAVLLLAGVAFAQMGWGPGMGWGHGPGLMGMMGPGMMGPGMMGSGMMGPGWQGGAYGCPGMAWSGQGQAPAAQISPDNAREIAQNYAKQYLQGFTVDKVLPFTGMGGMTMYSVELKGPKDEVRTLHVNPWGQVMPFGGPWGRTG
jgi:hypothetical protein